MTDTDLSQAYNIGLRCFGLLIYILFLFCIVSNIAIFVIGKQRYKDFFIVMYYTFFLGLAISRIIQTSLQLKYIYAPSVKMSIVAADTCSICIGLAQMSLLIDLIIVL